jgi:UDP-N-acetylmuramate dehydrogenase
MKVIQNANLRDYNTFGMDVSCKCLYLVETAVDIPALFEKGTFDSEYMMLGDGSNVLFTKPFQGAVIKMVTKGIAKLDEDADNVWLNVAAGEKWEDFVEHCIQNQYYGVENLIGIPGLVGSSPVQNIGAYGVEVKDVIEEVRGWRISAKSPFAFRNEDCQFSYRSSVFKTGLKGDCLITDVVFKLKKKEDYHISYQGLADELQKSDLSLSLRRVADAVVAVRNSKLPDIRQYGCAGSFFKNPIVEKDVLDTLRKEFPHMVSYPSGDGKVKLAAGQLIDLAGMKGVREGNVGVWPHQALVIVNYGNATGDEVVAFYRKVQKNVMERFGIRIEPEVNVI